MVLVLTMYSICKTSRQKMKTHQTNTLKTAKLVSWLFGYLVKLYISVAMHAHILTYSYGVRVMVSASIYLANTTVCLCVYGYVFWFDRNLIKAAFILLPILGCTWIFGIVAVNEKLIAFAWIFTILNSLQVCVHVCIHYLCVIL